MTLTSFLLGTLDIFCFATNEYDNRRPDAKRSQTDAGPNSLRTEFHGRGFSFTQGLTDNKFIQASIDERNMSFF